MPDVRLLNFLSFFFSLINFVGVTVLFTLYFPESAKKKKKKKREGKSQVHFYILSGKIGLSDRSDWFFVRSSDCPVFLIGESEQPLIQPLLLPHYPFSFWPSFSLSAIAVRRRRYFWPLRPLVIKPVEVKSGGFFCSRVSSLWISGIRRRGRRSVDPIGW